MPKPSNKVINKKACHHRTFCGTLIKNGEIWDMYTLGFCVVVTNGTEKRLLKDDSKIDKFVENAQILSWVADLDKEKSTPSQQYITELVQAKWAALANQNLIFD